MALVNNNEARRLDLGGHVQLNPGINEVPDDGWAKAKEIQLVKDYLEAKMLEEVSGEGQATTRGDPSAGLSGLTEEAATGTVQQTYDRILLTKWKQSEKRSAVVAALDTQLAAIGPPPGEKEASTTAPTSSGAHQTARSTSAAPAPSKRKE